MKKILILGTVLFSVNNLFAISEINYQQNYQDKIVPLIASMKEGTFIGQNKVGIHYRTLINENAHNCLVILPGRTEAVEKYAEVIYDLLQTDAGKNLSFYSMDHRGQGQSDRMASPADMGYVDLFDNYVSDVQTFIDLQKLDQHCDRKFLLAHSLGAGIGISLVLKNPYLFDRIAFSSPMLKIMTKPYSYLVARGIVDVEVLLGRGAKFALGQTGFDPNSSFADNTFTSSPERFKMAMSMFDTYPKAKLGGVSSRWVLEVMKGTNPLRSHYSEIKVPMRVFYAGIETYSEPSETVKLCNEAAACKSIFLPTAKHEVMMDRDINRDVVLNELSSFFN